MEGVDIRDRLVAYRADRGWSQARLVEESGVSGATIAHLETGANKRPRRITLTRIAQGFGVSLDDLLSDEPPRAAYLHRAPELELVPMFEARPAARRRALEAAHIDDIERYLRQVEEHKAHTEAEIMRTVAEANSAPDALRSGYESSLQGHIDYVYKLGQMRAEAESCLPSHASVEVLA